MNRIIHKLVIIAFAFISANALAQTISIGSDSGVAGAVVTIPVNFATGNQDIGNFTIDVAFDAAKFSSAVGDCSVANVNQTSTSCSDAAGLIRITMTRGSGALTTGLAANLVMTIADPVVPFAQGLAGSMVAIGFGGNDLDLDTIAVNDGTLTILGPIYGSTPAPGAGGGTEFAFGPVIQGNAVAAQNLTINNTGVVGTTLTGTCSLTANPSSVFLTDGDIGDETFSAAGQASDQIAVSCDSTKPFAGSIYSGVLTCSHNGTNVGDAIYDLTCNITDGPHPQFNASPSSLSFEAPQAGDVMPPKQSTITNIGDNPSTLTTSSACTLMGTHAGHYSLPGTTSYALADGGVETAVITVRCNADTEGDYNDAWVSCPHTDDVAGTGTIPLTCKVNPAGAAVYGSSPIGPGGIIDFTPGDDALVGTDPPNKTNNIQNTTTDVNDNELWVECTLEANAAISETTNNNGFFIAPDDFRPATFTCDASNLGNFNATYTCDYGVDGTESTSQTATYDVDCDVREPKTDVVPSPASGTPLEFLVEIGGTGTVGVNFVEMLDETGATDAVLGTCWLTGTDMAAFEITQPSSGAFPVSIDPGTTERVTVEGTDLGGKEVFNANLNCTYGDSDTPWNGDDEQGTTVVYPLIMRVGGVATFLVSKDFTDENPGDVDVRISCDNGLPLKSDSTISEGSPVTFVVDVFESGALNCEIFETVPRGYSASFSASGDSASSTTAVSCVFAAVNGGDDNFCEITNTPDPVDVVINKEWVFLGSSSDLIDIRYQLQLFCNAKIVDGNPVPNGTSSDPSSGNWYQVFEGAGSRTFKARVIPEYPSSRCWVEERVFDDTVEVENNCGNLVVRAGNGDSCTITNTVFFEGIPTLSQYGLAILALLMLGVGMVGFRRFS